MDTNIQYIGIHWEEQKQQNRAGKPLETRRRLARERKTRPSSSSEYGSRKK